MNRKVNQDEIDFSSIFPWAAFKTDLKTQQNQSTLSFEVNWWISFGFYPHKFNFLFVRNKSSHSLPNTSSDLFLELSDISRM